MRYENNVLKSDDMMMSLGSTEKLRAAAGSACTPVAAMLPETAWDGGAKLGCCMVTGGAALDGRISVVGPALMQRVHQTPGHSK